MKISESDIQAFAAFARRQTSESTDVTLVQLATRWEECRAEEEEANASIRASLTDIEAGRTKLFDVAQQEFRRSRNIT